MGVRVRGTRRSGSRGRIGRLVAVVSLGTVLVAPVALAAPSGAATISDNPAVLYANPAAEIGPLVNDGTHLWGEASGGCSSSRAPNSLVEFTESGAFVAAYPLTAGPGTCDGFVPVAANGSYVVTLTDQAIYVLDVATSTMTTYNESGVFTSGDGNTIYSIALSSTDAYVSSYADQQVVDVALSTGVTSHWSTHGTSGDFAPASLELVDGQLVSLMWDKTSSVYEWTSVSAASATVTPLLSTAFTNQALYLNVTVSGSDLYVVDGSAVYRYLYASPSLTEVAHATLATAQLLGVTVSNGSLWVTSLLAGGLFELDPSTLAVENEYVVNGHAPAWLVGSGASLFADDGFNGALLRLLPLAPVVTRVPTSTALDAASASSTYAAADILTATVSAPGTVTFDANGQPIAGCAGVAATTTATCAWAPDAVGAVTLTASLAPTDAADAPSASAPVSVTVQPAASTLQLTVRGPGAVAVAGAALTATATVSTPGTVTFSLDGATIPGCLGVPAVSTTATCAFRPGRAGSVRVAATLAPQSPDYGPSSQGVTFRVVAPSRAFQVGPFGLGGATLTASLGRRVAAVAAVLAADGYRVVRVTGFESALPGDAGRAVVRARVVAARLARDLAARGDRSVRVVLSPPGRGYPSVTVSGGF